VASFICWQGWSFGVVTSSRTSYKRSSVALSAVGSATTAATTTAAAATTTTTTTTTAAAAAPAAAATITTATTTTTTTTTLLLLLLLLLYQVTSRKRTMIVVWWRSPLAVLSVVPATPWNSSTTGRNTVINRSSRCRWEEGGIQGSYCCYE